MTDEYEATPEMTEEPHLGGGHPIDADASVRADGGGRPVTDLEGIGDTYGESLADAGVLIESNCSAVSTPASARLSP